MIKKIINQITKLSLISGLTIITALSSSLKTLALPTEQIAKTLQIPVFAVLDDQGAPLVIIDDKNDSKKQVTGIFINQDDANKFFQQVVQKQSPDLAKKAKVQLIDLGKFYGLVQNNQKQSDNLVFNYIPDQKQVEEAKKILINNGQKYTGGVPLFVARGGKDQGYLSMQRNNQTVIPMFFDAFQLQQMIESLKKEKPELASTIKIDVIPLESFIETMKKSDDQNLTKFVLIPSQEAIKAAQSFVPTTNATPTTNK